MIADRIRRYRPELVTLLVLAGISVGVLAGVRQDTFTVVALGALVAGIVVLSAGMIRLFAVAEGVFLLEAVGVAVVSPLLFERSVRFELYGVGLALAFLAGAFLSVAAKRSDRPAREGSGSRNL
ncbi:hypothetical protein [Halorubrum tibetense]|uniref:Uncharacterized protein n=1 Tax=Halorubrum tibetense TaxID=175631 RepID=A0ABD5SAM4_9EURY